jgi:hypothetical protein
VEEEEKSGCEERMRREEVKREEVKREGEERGGGDRGRTGKKKNRRASLLLENPPTWMQRKQVNSYKKFGYLLHTFQICVYDYRPKGVDSFHTFSLFMNTSSGVNGLEGVMT